MYTEELTEERKGIKPNNYSPVDFYNPNLEKFPDFQNVRGKMHVKLNPGDLLYLPAFWWHHVKSSKNRNIAINFWYTPNFMTVKMLGGIDENFHKLSEKQEL